MTRFPRTIVAMLIVSLIASATAVVSAASPAEAANDCSSQKSRTIEPSWINVLYVPTGRVYTRPFRQYVGEVMRAGEWPSHNHLTKLQVGALVTKQYAWYNVVTGPKGFSRGKCYHIRSDTMDQLWRPGLKPTSKQMSAVKAVWYLRLIKPKKGLFLTGYRTGYRKACASDTNRWKIFARSMGTCARKGWSPIRIVKKYLNVVYPKCRYKKMTIRKAVIKRGQKICVMP